MKKIIAVLLCMATVCACVGCGSTEETTKKSKKSKKTKDTTETEETEVPTDTETEPSDSTTETTASVPEELVITHDLSSVEITKMKDLMMFGAVDPVENPEPPFSLKSVEIGYDVLTTSDTSTKISSILQEYAHHTGDARHAAYEQQLAKFDDLVNTGSALFNYWFWENCEVVRSDSQILSLKITTYGYSTEEDIGTNTYYSNYDSMTGKEIAFDDVIRDSGAFANYVEACYHDVGADGMYASPTMADILDMITDGTLTFGMTYDAVWVYNVKVPVARHGDIFNMEYFGSTPADYTLEMDGLNRLTWDFDGDGVLDELKLEAVKPASSYGIETLKITCMGKEYSFKASEFEEMDYMEDLDGYHGSCVMCVDGKYYLLVTMEIEGEDYATYIFDISDGEPKYVDVFFAAPIERVNPKRFLIQLRTDIVGTVFMSYEFALGPDGHLQQLSSTGTCHVGPLLSTMPLEGKQYDVVTGTVAGEAEVPGGACVEILGYDNKSGLLFVRVHPKYTDMETMDIALETDKQSTIAGQPRDTAFIGISYAD